MSVIPLGERPPTPGKVRGLTPFALGFRPFFSVAVLAAILLMGLWLSLWSGQLRAPAYYYGATGWHSHEMLFGYAGAVIAGFLLTAVRNWTGIDTLTGLPLALLTLIWITGRILPFIPGVPEPIIGLVDLSFLPLLAAALYSPLMQGPNKINRIFLPLLAVMASGQPAGASAVARNLDQGRARHRPDAEHDPAVAHPGEWPGAALLYGKGDCRGPTPCSQAPGTLGIRPHHWLEPGGTGVPGLLVIESVGALA